MLPYDLPSRVDSHALRQIRMPLLHHHQPRCALSTTAFNSMNSYDDLNTRLLYKPLEGVERLEGYRLGGYHPTQIGDEFHNRHRVHKLGHRSYSTICLARDEKYYKYVAMKVRVADSNLKKMEIISLLTRAHYYPVKNSVKTMDPSNLDRFTIHGPNGRHTCYIIAPARASLSGLKDGLWIRLF